MAAQFIILLKEETDAARGELKFLDSPGDVARYIEVLIEGGYAKENIRVFHGTEIELAVSYRPVVALAAPEQDLAESATDSAQEDVGSQDGDLPDSDESDQAQGVRNGVRFSELFRPS